MGFQLSSQSSSRWTCLSRAIRFTTPSGSMYFEGYLCGAHILTVTSRHVLDSTEPLRVHVSERGFHFKRLCMFLPYPYRGRWSSKLVVSLNDRVVVLHDLRSWNILCYTSRSVDPRKLHDSRKSCLLSTICFGALAGHTSVAILTSYECTTSNSLADTWRRRPSENSYASTVAWWVSRDERSRIVRLVSLLRRSLLQKYFPKDRWCMKKQKYKIFVFGSRMTVSCEPGKISGRVCRFEIFQGTYVTCRNFNGKWKGLFTRSE